MYVVRFVFRSRMSRRVGNKDEPTNYNQQVPLILPLLQTGSQAGKQTNKQTCFSAYLSWLCPALLPVTRKLDYIWWEQMQVDANGSVELRVSVCVLSELPVSFRLGQAAEASQRACHVKQLKFE